MDDRVRMLDREDAFAVYKKTPSILIIDSDPALVPLVSIMIPTFRRPTLLREAVQSALLQITVTPFEVVVVDNENDAEMTKVVEEIILSFNASNLRLFRNQENIGMFGNWNRCIELARGRWLTILNDDDLLDPTYLTETLEILSGNNSISLLGCQVRWKDERNDQPINLVNGGSRQKLKSGIIKFQKKLRSKFISQKYSELTLVDYFFSYRHCGSLGIMMERKAALLVGGYSPNWHPCSDYIFLSRYILSNKVFFLPKILATYRVSENESLKPEMLIGWTRNMFQLREEMMPFLGVNSRLLRAYSRLCAIKFANDYVVNFNIKFDVNKFLAEEGLVNRATKNELFIIKQIILLLLLLRKKQ